VSDDDDEEATLMSLEDKAKNAVETARGKAKDVAGRVTDDPDLEAEGKADQVAGHLKQAGEKVKDAVHSAVPGSKK
jgi:uncharacterized protein YjbJ (UPF0337 family)